MQDDTGAAPATGVITEEALVWVCEYLDLNRQGTITAGLGVAQGKQIAAQWASL